MLAALAAIAASVADDTLWARCTEALAFACLFVVQLKLHRFLWRILEILRRRD